MNQEALERIFSSEEIKKRRDEIKKNQAELLAERIAARDTAEALRTTLEDSGMSRIIITKNPRPSTVIKPEPIPEPPKKKKLAPKKKVPTKEEVEAKKKEIENIKKELEALSREEEEIEEEEE